MKKSLLSVFTILMVFSIAAGLASCGATEAPQPTEAPAATEAAPTEAAAEEPTEAAAPPADTLQSERQAEQDPVLARLRTIELILVGAVIVLLIATLLLRRAFRRL